MEYNLTLLLLSNKEVELLKRHGYEDVAELNNCAVTFEQMREIKLILSRLTSSKQISGLTSSKQRRIDFTPEQVRLLKKKRMYDYLDLDGKYVGEDLYFEVNDYLDQYAYSHEDDEYYNVDSDESDNRLEI